MFHLGAVCLEYTSLRDFRPASADQFGLVGGEEFVQHFPMIVVKEPAHLSGSGHWFMRHRAQAHAAMSRFGDNWSLSIAI
jgi:hypothetical protein